MRTFPVSSGAFDKWRDGLLDALFEQGAFLTYRPTMMRRKRNRLVFTIEPSLLEVSK